MMERPQSLNGNQNGGSRVRVRIKEGEKESTKLKHQHAIRPFIANSKERRGKRDSRDQRISSIQITRSKSKHIEGPSRQLDDAPSIHHKNINDFCSELGVLKCEYKALKQCYNGLVREQEEATFRETQDRRKIESQLQKAQSETEQYRKHSFKLQQEIERLKKECCKLLDAERFKNKKLEETLQEKELMIAYLRNELQSFRKDSSHKRTPNQSALHFLQSSAPVFPFQISSNQNQSIISNVIVQGTKGRKIEHSHDEDSLSFSRDRSNFESLHSLISNYQEAKQTNEAKEIEPAPFLKKDLILLSSASQISEECPKMRSVKIKKGKADSEYVGKSFNRGQRSKMTTKRLQILTDQNRDLNEDFSTETKKKSSVNSSKPRKLPPTRSKKKTCV